MTSGLLVLLPPSESKSDGGNSRISDDFVADLQWPELNRIRRNLVTELITLSSGDGATAAAALKISAKQAEIELARNRDLLASPLRPAIERYSGVLFDAIGWESLDAAARAWISNHVAIHSALLGLVGAADCIPAYRCSYNSRLGAQSLRSHWASQVSSVLARHSGPILDLRSKGYVSLGPGTDSTEYCWLEIAERLPDGSVRSLNHFNKATKGRLVRKLASKFTSQQEPVAIQDVLTQLDAELERVDRRIIRAIFSAR